MMRRIAYAFAGLTLFTFSLCGPTATHAASEDFVDYESNGVLASHPRQLGEDDMGRSKMLKFGIGGAAIAAGIFGLKHMATPSTTKFAAVTSDRCTYTVNIGDAVREGKVLAPRRNADGSFDVHVRAIPGRRTVDVTYMGKESFFKQLMNKDRLQTTTIFVDHMCDMREDDGIAAYDLVLNEKDELSQIRVRLAEVAEARLPLPKIHDIQVPGVPRNHIIAHLDKLKFGERGMELDTIGDGCFCGVVPQNCEVTFSPRTNRLYFTPHHLGIPVPNGYIIKDAADAQYGLLNEWATYSGIVICFRKRQLGNGWDVRRVASLDRQL